MKTLITGDVGFLGSDLCDFLLEKGPEVICVDNLITGEAINIAHIKNESFSYIKHDVTKPVYIDGGIGEECKLFCKTNANNLLN